MLKHRISVQKSLCPVVICPYLCSSESREPIPGGQRAARRRRHAAEGRQGGEGHRRGGLGESASPAERARRESADSAGRARAGYVRKNTRQNMRCSWPRRGRPQKTRGRTCGAGSISRSGHRGPCARASSHPCPREGRGAQEGRAEQGLEEGEEETLVFLVPAYGKAVRYLCGLWTIRARSGKGH